MKNYLSTIDGSLPVDKFKYVFDADGFVPDATTFKNHLLANKNFYFDNFTNNNKAAYITKYGLNGVTPNSLNTIDDLIDQIISKRYSQIITSL